MTDTPLLQRGALLAALLLSTSAACSLFLDEGTPGRTHNPPTNNLAADGGANNNGDGDTGPHDTGANNGADPCEGVKCVDDGMDGHTDTHTDDTHDEPAAPCPPEALKREPGQCGCDVLDTDTDGDGTADCNDACILDEDTAVYPCRSCWGDAANIDAPSLPTGDLPEVHLTCSPTIDTALDPASMLTDWCGPAPTPVIQPQANGPALVVLPMGSFVLDASQTLHLKGDKPIVLAIAGSADLHGTIDAGGHRATPGPGGDDPQTGAIATAGVAGGEDCNIEANGSGQGREHNIDALGGGGAGFRTNGGFGGGHRSFFRCYGNINSYECKPSCPDLNCDNSFSINGGGFRANNGAHGQVLPVYGLAAPNLSLSPLRAGCAGGRGDGQNSNIGGAGGGALQLVVTGRLSLGPVAVISAGGGAGAGTNSHSGGSGGGSGGAILLEATTLRLSPTSALRAHGGSGGGRECGAAGAQDGHLTDDTHAVHPGCQSFGRGGLSFWDTTNPACDGTSPLPDAPGACARPPLDWPASDTAYPQEGGVSDNNGGGGGGGAGGVIRVRTLRGGGLCL